MASWRGPEFLSDEHVPTQRVRCPVHGFIRYSTPERRLIDHPLFQRLRNIRQLALTYYVYPGAMHTRFEHSLGVMDIATQAFDSLMRKHADELESNFRELPLLADKPLAKARQLVRLMGLLHDVGHTAFSHAGENLLAPRKHEEVSAWVLSPDGPLGAQLDRDFFEGASSALQELISGSDPAPQMLIIRQLLSGELDCDRIDYLLRDSLHCGVEYGRFDHLRLLDSLTVHPNTDTQSLAIGIESGGYHTFEGLILARYYMNTQVYFHRVRRAYDLMLRCWLDAWGSQNYQPMEQVLTYDDVALMALMQQDARGQSGSERSIWADRIVRRMHPKRVWELSDEHADAKLLLLARRVFKRLNEEYTDAELIMDEAEGSVHKLFVSGDDVFADDLLVVDPDGSTHSISTRSQIIQKIPKKFRMIRVFGYLPDEKLHDIRQRALELARQG